MTWISCRPAVLKDLPAIRAVLIETWHATYDRLYGTDRVTDITNTWHSLASLQAQLDRASPGKTTFLAGLWDGRVVATASARRIDSTAISLDRLYVRPPYQGLGIGTALLDAAITALPPPAKITLEVDPGNTDAIEFYGRYGFTKTGETTDCASGGFGIKAHIYERARA
jgi:ribosomal protein S18 acetylase RimI-like enzyme